MRNKLYTERLEIRITPKLHQKLKIEAGAQEITVNQLVREVIESYLS